MIRSGGFSLALGGGARVFDLKASVEGAVIPPGGGPSVFRRDEEQAIVPIPALGLGVRLGLRLGRQRGLARRLGGERGRPSGGLRLRPWSAIRRARPGLGVRQRGGRDEGGRRKGLFFVCRRPALQDLVEDGNEQAEDDTDEECEQRVSNGVGADRQPPGDLGGVRAGHQQREHLAFPGGQLLGQQRGGLVLW